jgi:GR25 family glycosyltransferase involved in LPS biosynthesis
MDRDKERLRKITTNLNKYNIKFQRIQAIEGKKLSQEEINQHTT